ncbi:hypothetical protein F2P81_012544 [Scophthalmus maximus]|uniref:TNFR-Cys domain-containing protein n=1 Tax=Scophthalmus maximus TaxID=52904 RepID=A0A6A4SHZ8_SCOMX|nr:hypothetical protein F2P81_012544 [Scophthalmus maximus]
MSSPGRVDALRERNQHLLNELKRQREKLERLSGRGQNRKRDREDEAEEERRRPEETATRTEGDRGAARAALLKPTVRFADARERQTCVQRTVSTPPATSTHGGAAQHADPSDVLKDSDMCLQVQDGLRDTRLHNNTKSCLVKNLEEQREEPSGGTFQSDECEEIPASDRHRLQPLLGYDWIAGILDAEDTFVERPDEFFNDLRIFRSLHKNDCVHSPQAAAFSAENHPGLALLIDKDAPEANTDTHQCTFSYRMNSRLFPVPLHSQDCCPVCKKHKSSHPHTTSEPALVRVSIPRSTLLPPYKYKAHRRCSFDPSDSLGLPSVCSQPYEADSDGKCRNPTAEYLLDDSDLCCKKCPPGTAKSDVRCEQCPDGMFSDTHSSTDPCRPHTNCHGAAVRKANATSDTVCEREVVTATLLQDTTKEHRNGIVSTNAKTIRSTVFTISDSTLSVRPSVTKEVFNHSTENLLPHKVPDIKLAAAIAGAVGFLLLFIIIILGFLFKLVRKKDAARFHPKLDANGNCESVDEQIISTAGYLEETLLTAFTVNSPEQQCLLEGAGSCSDYSQPSSNTETLTRTDDCNGHESVGPLQSTLALNNPNSCPFLSEPMTLISNAGPVTPQPSGPSQSSSQSSSPQIISPVTTSPHVNVNITFHIGNGSCGTPPVMPMESNNHLPFGEEEQSISIPQQEDGKHSLRSVQDSESYSV